MVDGYLRIEKLDNELKYWYCFEQTKKLINRLSRVKIQYIRPYK
jgi:hypothetical protein